ncbi:helix-turn-helix domain-containing protein [Streptomyces sp. NPDC003038]|uniref:helix-turn-helix domain-containing protein n=1 Tax=unclassified Streptomyces TaxID=2593676 RepID=UPI0033B77CA4
MVTQERAARTREALVRAAAEVFAGQGFAAASVAVISRRAGVSAGGLHFHFESKTALARAVEDRAALALGRITVARPGAAVAGIPGVAAAAGVCAGSGVCGVAGAAGGSGTCGGAGRAGGCGCGCGQGVGVVGGNALQVLVDSTHALIGLLAGDVVVRAGFALCADVSRGSGADLRRQWRLWVEEVIRAAACEGVLAEGVCPQDAARAVVAWTVGLEVLGARERDWTTPHTLTRLWTLMLPLLAAGGTLGAVMPQGTGGGPSRLRPGGPSDSGAERSAGAASPAGMCSAGPAGPSGCVGPAGPVGPGGPAGSGVGPPCRDGSG